MPLSPGLPGHCDPRTGAVTGGGQLSAEKFLLRNVFGHDFQREVQKYFGYCQNITFGGSQARPCVLRLARELGRPQKKKAVDMVFISSTWLKCSAVRTSDSLDLWEL